MSAISTIAGPVAGQIQQAQSLASRRLEELGGAGDVALGAPSSGVQSFGKALTSFVQDVDTKLKASGAERTKVLAGDTTNLHQAMIAGQEASISFTFMVELRNKLVESYQELMRSQI